jgi:hypothetical protein
LEKLPTAQQNTPPEAHQPNEFEKRVADWTRILGIATILLFIATLTSNYFSGLSP